MTSVAVNFGWRSAGAVTLDPAGSLLFPKVGQVPGIYRFNLSDPRTGYSAYIGETDRVDRRFNGYRNPGPSQATNLRVNPLLVGTLRLGGTVTIELAGSVTMTINGVPAAVDLSWKPTRLIVENAALLEARAQGVVLHNR